MLSAFCGAVAPLWIFPKPPRDFLLSRVKAGYITPQTVKKYLVF